jgi:predicted metallo-beta-lactamase superfamily hydrolase
MNNLKNAKRTLRAIIREEVRRVIAERRVYRSAEFEEMNSAIEKILDNLPAFGALARDARGPVRDVQKALQSLRELIDQYGFEDR